MSWNLLRTQIATLLGTISGIQEVSVFPKIQFEGYPAAHIVPSNNEADYETTTENKRTYAYRVRFFYETKNTGVGDALTALENIVDAALDLFDQEDLKGNNDRTVGINLASNKTFLRIWATPSFFDELAAEELVMAELLVRVTMSVDIS